MEKDIGDRTSQTEVRRTAASWWYKNRQVLDWKCRSLGKHRTNGKQLAGRTFVRENVPNGFRLRFYPGEMREGAGSCSEYQRVFGVGRMLRCGTKLKVAHESSAWEKDILAGDGSEQERASCRGSGGNISVWSWPVKDTIVKVLNCRKVVWKTRKKGCNGVL